jgi:stage V sporulation protein R
MCMRQGELKELERAIAEITEIAEGFGLDFYPMRYEICPADIIYTFGAYGIPTRFSHWSFGKQFYKMKLQYGLRFAKELKKKIWLTQKYNTFESAASL